METLQIFGDIAADKYFESDVTPQMVADFFAHATGDVTIELNSNGGDVTAGIAIANMIRDYQGGKVTAKVLGLAASMASVIACAADELVMGTGSFLMVHNPWTQTWGNADELRKDADTLDKLRDAMLQFYSTKFELTPDELKDMMSGETWIAAEHAEDFKLRAVKAEVQFAAAAHLTRAHFQNAPEAALIYAGEHREQVPGDHDDGNSRPGPVDSPAASSPDWEARFKGASRKINELQAALAASGEAKAKLAQDLDGARKDLAAAQAKASELEGEIVKAKASLEKSQGELAQTRDSLQAATSEIEDLKAKRTLLTAGVLTPGPDQSYEAKMKAAQTPEAREALRQQKREGKIK